MKKLLLPILAVVLLFAFVGTALAATPPSVIDPVTGASAWTYKDAYDATAKYEGGYNAFTGTVNGTLTTVTGTGDTLTVTNTPYSNQGYVASPHGGYDTTTNKCKVCHAVHRAEGAYYLLRADSQDDACSYCHLGGSAHSSKVVYDLNPDGINTTNGHTIGAQTQIPDSTKRQFANPVTLTTTDANGFPLTETIQVRAYDSAKLEMYRFGRHHGQSDEGTGRGGYAQIGPLALRCMGCHQTHNALDEVWRPLAWQGAAWPDPVQSLTQFEATGYKLLKRYPSAATTGAPNAYGRFDPGQQIGMPEGNLVKAPAGTTGNYNVSTFGPWGVEKANFSGDYSAAFVYQQNGETRAAPLWIAQDIHEPEVAAYPTQGTGYYRYPYFNSKYAMSTWCSDCHNLNIGGWEPLTDPELGFKAHNERTHPSPYYGAYTGPGQCYSCHRNDLSAKMGVISATNPATVSNGRATVAGRDSCTQCHYGTKDYAIEMGNETVAGAPNAQPDLGLDFPHSGQTNTIKMLGSYTVSMPAGGGTILGATTVIPKAIGEGNLDAVCLRCHPGVGVHQ